MRYLFTLIILLTLATPAHAVMFISGTSAVGGTACSTTIADDFSGDLSKWTEPWTSSLWSIVTGEARGTGQAVLLYTDETTCTVTQWVMAKFAHPSNTFLGVYLRSQNDESTYAYAVRWEDGTGGNDFQWRYCGGSANSNTGENCTTIGSGWTPGTPLDTDDYVGVEITGTGTNTEVKIYDLGTTAKNYSNWATSNDQTITLTDDPAQEANVGKYVGVHNGAGTNVFIDDFSAASP